ncbi:MAG: hypothetical protein CMJ81_10820 [Planctomycetaceae bacterium]|nr:hypothetical protein [Planctomycetaceae bacterium]
MRMFIGFVVLQVTFFYNFPAARHSDAAHPSASGGAPAASAQPPTRPLGINQRIPWTTSRVKGSPEPPLPYHAERVFSKLSFLEPVELTNIPGTDRLIVVQREGKIYSFHNRPDCATADLALDMAAGIDGMKQVYGLTFHPDFEKNRYCYLCYVLDPQLPEGTRVSRFTMTRADPPQIDPDSEQILLTWISGGHNGGCLKFGPDGYLYISTGDSGPGSPPDAKNAGQDISDLTASILRIDVDRHETETRYGVPADNPFLNQRGARPEIWAYGFRNPWKMSFDQATGDLWVGDVGWVQWELIYRVERGSNYGWSVMEGRAAVRPRSPRGPTPISPPLVDHPRHEARSITGGFVYRGDRLAELVGAYIYGDYETGKLWGLRFDGERTTWHQELADTVLQLVCFGEDHSGELYLVDYVGGIYRLSPHPAAAVKEDEVSEFPTQLSQTGLFTSVAGQIPSPGVIPYSVNTEPWSDHALARRYLALPGTGQIKVAADQPTGSWEFPEGAVLAKTLSLEMEHGQPGSLRHLETQLLHFQDNSWRAYSYRWNQEQTDATLVESSGAQQTVTISDPRTSAGTRQQTWRFASRTECLLCHKTKSRSALGMNVLQLNRAHDDGAVVDNQLRTWAQLGIFTESWDTPLEKLPAMVDPLDSTGELNGRARSYLHANCAHCHRFGYGGTVTIGLRYDLDLQKTNTLGTPPALGSFGITSANIVAPGDPYRSVMHYRMATLGRGRMPHAGSGLVDVQGVALISDWICALAAEEDDAEAPPQSTEQRLAAEIALLQAQDPPAAEIAEPAIERLLSSISGSLLLLGAVADDRLTPPLRQRVIHQGTRHSELLVQNLFERFLPADQRRKRLGTKVDPDQILPLEGDAGQGRKIFFDVEGIQCKTCHTIGGKGRPLGPDLTQIGKKFNRRQLLESILQPSKAVDPKYVQHLVETRDGRVYTGLIAETTADELVLLDASYQKIHLSTADIELQLPQRQSLMPDLQLRDMTAQDVADLLDFLLSLR